MRFIGGEPSNPPVTGPTAAAAAAAAATAQSNAGGPAGNVHPDRCAAGNGHAHDSLVMLTTVLCPSGCSLPCLLPSAHGRTGESVIDEGLRLRGWRGEGFTCTMTDDANAPAAQQVATSWPITIPARNAPAHCARPPQSCRCYEQAGGAAEIGGRWRRRRRRRERRRGGW